jgi:hypothetical protein
MRQKKHQHFSVVSLPTDSVDPDHAVEGIQRTMYFIKISILLMNPVEEKSNFD